MKYKILQLDANGRISFTKEELEKLLEEVYNNGYEDGRKTCWYPYWTYKTEPTYPNIVWTGNGTQPTIDKTIIGDYPRDTTGVNSTTCTGIPDDPFHYTYSSGTGTTTSRNCADTSNIKARM